MKLCRVFVEERGLCNGADCWRGDMLMGRFFNNVRFVCVDDYL